MEENEIKVPPVPENTDAEVNSNDSEFDNAASQLSNDNVSTDPVVRSTKKSKKTKRKGGWPKGKPRTPKSNPNSNTNSNNGQDSQNEYQRLRNEYLNNVDPDARKDQGAETLEVEEESETISGKTTRVDKKPMGNSLIAMTKIVLPALCSLGIRVASRGKKKVATKLLRLDEYHIATLNELADGAADEILGKLNPAFSFALVLAAIGIEISMNAWDAAESTPQIITQKAEEMVPKSEADELRKQLAELKGESV